MPMPIDIKDKNFLVADDSSTMRRVVRSCLNRYGASDQNIAEAGDGLEALTILQAKAIDCVLADWNMPNCDGLQLLTKMRQIDRYKHTPFLIFTTESTKEDILTALRAGVNAYMAKPITPELVAKKLNEVFS